MFDDEDVFRSRRGDEDEDRYREPYDDEETDADDDPEEERSSKRGRSARRKARGKATKKSSRGARPQEPDDDEDDDRPPKKGGGFLSAWKKPAPKKAKSAAKPKTSGSKFAGGRGLVLALRAFVWVVLLIVLAAGIKNIVTPTRTDIPTLTEQVKANLNLPTFPSEQGISLATAFAKDYLTYTPAGSVTRQAELFAYLPQSAKSDDPSLAWTADRVATPQVVVDGPFIAGPPIVDGTRAEVQVAVKIGNPETEDQAGNLADARWVMLAVPLAADENGKVSVAGAPAFVPAPLSGKAGAPLALTVDAAATESLQSELPLMLEAWAASDQAGLKRFLPADATDAVRAGMNGTVEFVSLDLLQVEAPPAPGVPSSALATVTWNSSGTELQQQYRLKVHQTGEGLWLVDDIAGAGFTIP